MDTTTSAPTAAGTLGQPTSRASLSAIRLRWMAITWGTAVLYFASNFDRRWVPHDEGTIGQTAWRILLGEVPHRDFDALYTGLLGYLNATAMAVMGVHLLAPRAVLLLGFVAWVAAVWSIVSRFLAPPLAAAATLLCVTVGPAVYPAAMPSWYNLFLATGGLWALIRWTEDARSRWLLVAGACAGVSALFKVTGLYFLAAALFTVLHAELSRGDTAPRPATSGAGPRVRLTAYAPALFATLAPTALVAMVVALVRSQLGVGVVVHYVLPTLALAVVVSWRAWTRPRPGRDLLVRVLRGWALITCAFAAPVAVYVAAFAAMGAADELYRGVFVLPMRRLVAAAGGPLPPHWAAGTIAPLALIILERRLGPTGKVRLAAATILAGVALLAFSDIPGLYRAIWFSLWLIVPVGVLVGAWAVTRGGQRGGPSGGGADVHALVPVLWTATLTSLLQFPLAGPIYFAHIAPMGVLAAAGVLGALWNEAASHESSLVVRAAAGRPVLLAIMAFYVAFLVVGPDRSFYLAPPTSSSPVRLALDRGRIRVGPEAAEAYVQLTAALQDLSRSEWIYVTPDAPEVYFLSGFRNPTRTLFEIFDEPGSAQRIPDLLDRHGVNVVVFNTAAHFSPPPLELAAELERLYPNDGRVGPFIVRWR